MGGSCQMSRCTLGDVAKTGGGWPCDHCCLCPQCPLRDGLAPIPSLDLNGLFLERDKTSGSNFFCVPPDELVVGLMLVRHQTLQTDTLKNVSEEQVSYRHTLNSCSAAFAVSSTRKHHFYYFFTACFCTQPTALTF